jgi:CheY-like chemotaxis protein
MEKILINQHDRAARRPLKLLLEPERYIVEAGSDGTSGLVALRRSQPTLVILDLKLPESAGGRAAAKSREKYRRWAVLVLTAVADVLRREERQLITRLEIHLHVTPHFRSHRELTKLLRFCDNSLSTVYQAVVLNRGRHEGCYASRLSDVRATE